jgi:hypothetical protein
MKQIPTNKYLKDTIEDALKKVGSQHAINKEVLIAICKELLKLRGEKE